MPSAQGSNSTPHCIYSGAPCGARPGVEFVPDATDGSRFGPCVPVGVKFDTILELSAFATVLSTSVIHVSAHSGSIIYHIKMGCKPKA